MTVIQMATALTLKEQVKNDITQEDLAEKLRSEAWDIAHMEREVERAVRSIHNVIRSGHALALGFSSGKDSTLCLCLLLHALREAQSEGLPIPPCRIFSADTRVENPEVTRLMGQAADSVATFSQEHGLDIEIEICRPTDYEDYLTRVLSGRALPAMPWTSGNCTDWLKLTPVRRAQRVFKEQARAAGWRMPVTITGVRADESARRANNMSSRGEASDVLSIQRKDGSFTTIPNDGGVNSQAEDMGDHLTLALIAHWPTASVFRYLQGAGTDKTWPGYQADFEDLLEFYSDAATGACTVVDNPYAAGRKRSGCSARSGCHTCLKVGQEDKGAQQLALSPKYPYYENLARFRDALGVYSCDLSKRNWMGRTLDPETGTIGVFPNTLHPEAAEELLRMYLSMDRMERDRARKRTKAMEEKSAKFQQAGLTFNDPWPHLNEPQFTAMSLRQILVLTACCAREDFGAPLWPIRAWMDVMLKGELTTIPEVDRDRIRPPKMPKTRYIQVSQSMFERAWGLDNPLEIASKFDGDMVEPIAVGDQISAGDDDAVAFWMMDELPRLFASHPASNAALLGHMIRWGVIQVSSRQWSFCDYKARQHAAMKACDIPTVAQEADLANLHLLESAADAPGWESHKSEERVNPDDAFSETYRRALNLALSRSMGWSVKDDEWQSTVNRLRYWRSRVSSESVKQIEQQSGDVIAQVEKALQSGDKDAAQAIALTGLGSHAMLHAHIVDWSSVCCESALRIDHPAMRSEQLAMNF